MTTLGTPLSPSATKVMLLGSGELGKEVLIALQRLGVETIAVDRYENAPGQQVAHHARTITMSDPAQLKALIEAEGGQARLLPIARDNEAELATVLGLAEDADLIVTIGGASVGDHDLVGKTAGLEHSFWKIAMRPGKPLMAGRLNSIPMLGLPGNPVSAVVCGHLFLLPMVRAMLGDPAPAPQLRRARLALDLPANGPRAHYMRSRLTLGNGLPDITPFDRQDSALLSILGQADALLIRPIKDGPVHAGTTVDYLPI